MSKEIFAKYTPENAPDGAGVYLAGAQQQFGFIPDPMARMAASKSVIDGFMKANTIFEQNTDFSPLEREVLVMTVGRVNGCHYCMAMHSAIMTRMDAPPAVIKALRSGKKLDDAKLEALSQFTRSVLDNKGKASEATLRAFLAAGYTTRHALDVVLGAGVYAITTYANRLTDADLDPAFEAFRWEPSEASK